MAASHLSSLKIYVGNHRLKYEIKIVQTSVACGTKICPDRYNGLLNPDTIGSVNPDSKSGSEERDRKKRPIYVFKSWMFSLPGAKKNTLK
jgi:hypothetical protein